MNMRAKAVQEMGWPDRTGTLPKWLPPNTPKVHDWVGRLSEGGSPLLVVSGPNGEYRHEAYRSCYDTPGIVTWGHARNVHDWLAANLTEDLTQRVRKLTGRPWGIVWDLLEVADFIIEEPLRGLVDQGLRFTGLFRALWETRLLLQEQRKDESFALLGAVLRWVSAQELSPEHRIELGKMQIQRELESSQERLDMLLFLLALAYQNGLVDRTVFVFDDLDHALRVPLDQRRACVRQIADLVTALERWARLGSATGVVFGVDMSSSTAFSNVAAHNDRLAQKLIQARI